MGRIDLFCFWYCIATLISARWFNGLMVQWCKGDLYTRPELDVTACYARGKLGNFASDAGMLRDMVRLLLMWRALLSSRDEILPHNTMSS